MESAEQRLSSLKALCLKNRGKLEQFSELVCKHEPISPPALAHFPQIKQQYQIILSASKDSIDRNAHLQAQLDSKHHYLKALNEKLNRHTRQLQGLTDQMARATGNLNKHRKTNRELLTSEQINSKLKKDLEKLTKKQAELRRQCDLLDTKEGTLKGQLSRSTAEVLEIEMRLEREESKSERRLQELRREVKRCRQNVADERILSTSRVGTPERSVEKKKKNFEEIQTIIKHYKEKAMMI